MRWPKACPRKTCDTSALLSCIWRMASFLHKFSAPLLPPLVCRTWALLPLNKLCQMNASLSSNSMSFSVHSFVGRDCKNIMISWKSICWSLSDHLTRKAAQT